LQRAARETRLVCVTHEFDGVALDAANMEVSTAERQRAKEYVAPELQKALTQAAENIRFFHEHQRLQGWRVEREGVVLEQRVLPIARVGIYIPGGRAKYPSTVLMTAIPGQIAGVEEIIMASPPDRQTGVIDPSLIMAAEIAGVHRIFRLGGAQAIAAVAYGTATIPAVDKIVGPGNAYVAEAKRQVFGRVGIDMLAGPTEVVLFVDHTAPVAVVVQDMFAQMEHDPVTRAVVISTDAKHLQKIVAHAEKEIGQATREEILHQVWEDNTFFLHASDDEIACAAVNALAPEHLQVMTAAPREFLSQIRHASAIFLGQYSPVVGRLRCQSNHAADQPWRRYSSPLGVYDFVRHQHVVEYTEAAWMRERYIAYELACAEQLYNHSFSALLNRESNNELNSPQV
jgi:histidinol dehydrogenase